ncbi:MAG: hypothetical protein J2P17_08510, partial [Mycobacterium sp.]|nr:hypothetical protein [Mycobacterium sp.]
ARTGRFDYTTLTPAQRQNAINTIAQNHAATGAATTRNWIAWARNQLGSTARHIAFRANLDVGLEESAYREFDLAELVEKDAHIWMRSSRLDTLAVRRIGNTDMAWLYDPAAGTISRINSQQLSEEMTSRAITDAVVAAPPTSSTTTSEHMREAIQAAGLKPAEGTVDGVADVLSELSARYPDRHGQHDTGRDQMSVTELLTHTRGRLRPFSDSDVEELGQLEAGATALIVEYYTDDTYPYTYLIGHDTERLHNALIKQHQGPRDPKLAGAYIAYFDPSGVAKSRPTVFGSKPQSPQTDFAGIFTALISTTRRPAARVRTQTGNRTPDEILAGLTTGTIEPGSRPPSRRAQTSSAIPVGPGGVRAPPANDGSSTRPQPLEDAPSAQDDARNHPPATAQTTHTTPATTASKTKPEAESPHTNGPAPTDSGNRLTLGNIRAALRIDDDTESIDSTTNPTSTHTLTAAISSQADIPPQPGPTERYGWMTAARWRQHVMDSRPARTTPPAPDNPKPATSTSARRHASADQAAPAFSRDAIDAVVANRQAVDWNMVVGDNRVVLLGEAHSNTPIRDFLTAQAQAIKAAGVTHYGIEAPPHPAIDKLNDGRRAYLGGVHVGPGESAGYERVIQAMSAAGIIIVPLDLDPSGSWPAGARDKHMADTITAIVSENPGAKVAALLGEFHTINEESEGQPAAGQILHASGYPTTTVQFAGGAEEYTRTLLAEALRNHNATGETFYADLRDYHNAGGSYAPGHDAVIHLPATTVTAHTTPATTAEGPLWSFGTFQAELTTSESVTSELLSRPAYRTWRGFNTDVLPSFRLADPHPTTPPTVTTTRGDGSTTHTTTTNPPRTTQNPPTDCLLQSLTGIQDDTGSTTIQTHILTTDSQTTPLPGHSRQEAETAAGSRFYGYGSEHHIASELLRLPPGSQAEVIGVHPTVNANGIGAHAFRMTNGRWDNGKLVEAGTIFTVDDGDPDHTQPEPGTWASLHAAFYTRDGQTITPRQPHNDLPALPDDIRIGAPTTTSSDFAIFRPITLDQWEHIIGDVRAAPSCGIPVPMITVKWVEVSNRLFGGQQHSPHSATVTNGFDCEIDGRDQEFTRELTRRLSGPGVRNIRIRAGDTTENDNRPIATLLAEYENNTHRPGSDIQIGRWTGLIARAGEQNVPDDDGGASPDGQFLNLLDRTPVFRRNEVLNNREARNRLKIDNGRAYRGDSDRLLGRDGDEHLYYVMHRARFYLTADKDPAMLLNHPSEEADAAGTITFRHGKLLALTRRSPNYPPGTWRMGLEALRELITRQGAQLHEHFVLDPTLLPTGLP